MHGRFTDGAEAGAAVEGEFRKKAEPGIEVRDQALGAGTATTDEGTALRHDDPRHPRPCGLPGVAKGSRTAPGLTILFPIPDGASVLPASGCRHVKFA